MKLILKATLITLIVFCTVFIAKAQIGYDYSKYDAGVAIGFNKAYADVKSQTTTETVHLNFTFNQTPFTNFVFEAQLGRLAGADSLKMPKGREFKSTLTSFVFRGQVQFGEFLDYSRSPFMNALKNFYVSAGIGYESTHITFIQRFSNQGLVTGGELNTQEPFIPLRIGYEFKLFNKYQQPSVKFDLGYEYNQILGDGLDGFKSGLNNDAYAQYTIGIKFAIGGNVTSYRKPITY